MINYYLLLRTAQAEMRSWDYLIENYKKNIIPIFEITRGNKLREKNPLVKSITNDIYRDLNVYNFYGIHFEKAKKIINSSSTCFIDITPEATLMCGELYELKRYNNGYINWVNFLEKNFNKKNVIPILQITSDDLTDEDYIENLRLQFELLSNNYSAVGYRISALTEIDYLVMDLNLLHNQIKHHIKNKSFFLILDHEDTRPKTSIFHADQSIHKIKEILNKIPEIKIIILSSSFPKSISEVGTGDTGEINIEEIALFKGIKMNVDPNYNILYGDYGSINSIRNDGKIIGGRGWTPRIDVPYEEKIYYYKEKKEIDPVNGKFKHQYNYYYNRLANKIKENGLLSKLPDCWAKEQISLSTINQEKVPSSIPNFWISVRMQLYIINLVNQLDKIYN